MTQFNFANAFIGQPVAVKDFFGNIIHVTTVENITQEYLVADGVRFSIARGTALCNQKTESWVALKPETIRSDASGRRLQDKAARLAPFDTEQLRTVTIEKTISTTINRQDGFDMDDLEALAKQLLHDNNMSDAQATNIMVLEDTMTCKATLVRTETFLEYVDRTYRLPKLEKAAKAKLKRKQQAAKKQVKPATNPSKIAA